MSLPNFPILSFLLCSGPELERVFNLEAVTASKKIALYELGGLETLWEANTQQITGFIKAPVTFHKSSSNFPYKSKQIKLYMRIICQWAIHTEIKYTNFRFCFILGWFFVFLFTFTARFNTCIFLNCHCPPSAEQDFPFPFLEVFERFHIYIYCFWLFFF